MNRFLIPVVALIAIVGGVAALGLVLASDGDSEADEQPERSIDSDSEGNQAPVTSADDIDPDECSAVHNIDACGETADEGGQAPITSADGIDPDECNRIHNVDACATP